MTFQKILIANRGEIAVRLIRACREMGIRTAAVYSEVDAGAMHVRLADEAILVGLAEPAGSYLNIERIIAVARATGCEAIHPGYGFLSESPEFAEAVSGAGIVFIGPPTEAIRRMGVKTEARAIMQSAGVPVVPGFQGEGAIDSDFQRAADEIGYPVMVKAAGGGGGKGIRIVHAPGELAEALGAARREAEHAFGDPTLYLEKYIGHARHIEVQVLADSLGNTVHLFERECSVQRRHQKIVEETPSPHLTPDNRARMGAAAVNAARAAGYVNAGTVEFIADADGNFYFMEMNTRLQVEHPITELVTGVDLAQLQIRIAAGEPLPFRQEDLGQRGHAIECRVYAEDPSSGFLPATGRVLKSIEPGGPGIRVDAGVVTGDSVSLYYDPLVAKLIVLAEDRDSAIRRMVAALGQYAILGLTTNLGFLQDVIRHPDFAAGRVDTEWVEATLLPWTPGEVELPPEVLIAAALSELGAGTPAAGSADSDGDVFSPWGRTDGFRMGGSV